MVGDLTTLAKVKSYLAIDPYDASADAVLSTLISTQSRLFRSKARRDILYQKYTETRDGTGQPGIEPWQYPVQSVVSVLIDNVTIPAEPTTVAGDAPQYGWVLSRDRIEIVRYPDSLTGFVPDYGGFGYGSSPYRFSRGSGNVVLTYWAGYFVSGEAGTIPGSPYQVQAQDNFYSDSGVTFASGGAALTKVTSAPTASQYSVSATGLYTFAAADTGKGVLLSYAVVPADIEQAVTDMVAWVYARRTREATRSKSGIGGESIVYQTDAIPPSAQAVIDLYERQQV